MAHMNGHIDLPTDNQMAANTSSTTQLDCSVSSAPEPGCFTNLLVSFPYIFITVAAAMAAIMGGTGFYFHHLPDFQEPTKGFETRGTPIMDCSLTHNKVIKALKLSNLSFVPFIQGGNASPGENIPDLRSHVSKNDIPCPTIFSAFDLDASQKRIVFESSSGQNLFTAKALKAICSLEKKFITPYMRTKCHKPSVAYYVANVMKKNCSQLSEDDIAKVTEELQECYPFYGNGTMKCLDNPNCTLPYKCKPGGGIFQIFYYLADVNFTTRLQSGEPNLKYAALVLSNENFDWRSLYSDHLDGKTVEKDGVKLAAVFMGEYAKFSLFSVHLIQDIRWFGLAMGLVLLVMMVYLHSPTLMFATVLNVAFSFSIAYFVYFFILRMEFYPFVNILAALLLIAVGADDVFIFHDMWEQAKREHPSWSHAQWMRQTFSHAALSITVTSLTTGAAFFSNLMSSITAIRCFGIFAGVAIMANLLLMVTWTPAVIVALDKLTTLCCKKVWCSDNMSNFVRKYIHPVYQQWFPTLIEKGRYVWLVLFLGYGVAGLVFTFYKPGLQLPSSSEYQLFPDWHLMERWDKELKLKFQAVIDDVNKHKHNISALFTWGFKNKDNGNWLNPDDLGTLEYDPTFDGLTSASLAATNYFCHSLHNQTFISPGQTQCLYDKILSAGRKLCSDPLIAQLAPQCCSDSKVNYECLKLPFSGDLDPNITQQLIMIFKDGPYLFNHNNSIVGIFHNVSTTFPFAFNYDSMDKAYKTVDKFLQEQKQLMPKEMQSLCFSAGGDFKFYDLQRSISEGTYTAICLSLGVAAFMMLLTSRNVLVTLYAIVTILLAIAATVGTLVHIGWHLNILESITISLSVGLSIDFTIHYGVAYRVSEAPERASRVNEGFYRVGSAVAVAAATSFLAGAAVMPSRILAYTQLGVFLMLVMTFSWLYSTFFFQSLCHLIGPKGTFCQVPSPLSLCQKKKTNTYSINPYLDHATQIFSCMVDCNHKEKVQPVTSLKINCITR